MVFLININISSEEYQNILISCSWLKNNQQNILWIDKVVHPKFKKRYDSYKESLDTQTKEVYPLFHGSTENSFNHILKKGFMSCYNRVSVYGVGSYFATDASNSYKNYSNLNSEKSKYLFICRICFLEKQQGKNNEIIDNPNNVFVNNLLNPTIYSVPNDSAILIEYVVCFNESISQL